MTLTSVNKLFLNYVKDTLCVVNSHYSAALDPKNI